MTMLPPRPAWTCRRGFLWHWIPPAKDGGMQALVAGCRCKQHGHVVRHSIPLPCKGGGVGLQQWVLLLFACERTQAGDRGLKPWPSGGKFAACCRTGKITLTRKEIAQLIGRVFIQKAAVNLLSTVLDTPEFFWSAPDSMQNLYKRVCEYMELEERVEVLNGRFAVRVLRR
jgi:Uncharacterised ACR, YagE family COG1723